jgi:hypothetical protein
MLFFFFGYMLRIFYCLRVIVVVLNFKNAMGKKKKNYAKIVILTLNLDFIIRCALGRRRGLPRRDRGHHFESGEQHGAHRRRDL